MGFLSQYFVHPLFLGLLPLVGLPIIIHLLNRIRYRRVKWAAMKFLLTTERRAVRRAKLQQLLLMALRTLLLLAALLVLAQPIFRGGMARLLGGTSQVAVLVDASASMSAAHASGSAFSLAQRSVEKVLVAMPHASKATATVFAVNAESTFGEPVSDRAAVASVVNDGKLTGGASDIPRAILSAAESLGRSGGGGVIWLLTDLQAGDWRVADSGAWQKVREGLIKAGKPRLVISDVSTTARSNFSVASVRVVPALLAEGDMPTVTASVELHGTEAGLAEVSLFVGEKPAGRQTRQFTGPGKQDFVFRLSAIEAGTHVCRIQLGRDALPADNAYNFLLSTARQTPVLVVEGAPSALAFEDGADFINLAVKPPQSEMGARSMFEPETIPAKDLSGRKLTKYGAVFLSSVARLDERSARDLKAYVEAGGLLVIFPGAAHDKTAWNALKFTGVTYQGVLSVFEEDPMKIGWTAQAHPLTASLPGEGIDEIKIKTLHRMKVAAKDSVLMATDKGHPFLVQAQLGRGKVVTVAVSARDKESNFPLTLPFLLTMHRILRSHMVEASEPLARTAFSELRLPVPSSEFRMMTPGGKALPLGPVADAPGEALFDRTDTAGIYRLVKSRAADTDVGDAVAAIVVPPGESRLERIDMSKVQNLMPEAEISLVQIDENMDAVSSSRGGPTAASSFPLAVLAVLFLLGEVLLAWSMSRPRTRPDAGDGAATEPGTSAA